MASRFDIRGAAWFIPASLLNILFLGTSHALSHLPIAYWGLYVFVTVKLAMPLNGNIQTFYDLSSMALVSLMLLLSYWAFIRDGFTRATTKTLQLLSATFLPLGVEIFAFDRAEWAMNFANFQVVYNIAPWFSNQDLFACMLAVFSLATLLGRLNGRGAVDKGSGSAAGRLPLTAVSDPGPRGLEDPALVGPGPSRGSD